MSSGSRGFTLLEVLVAVALLGLGISVGLGAISAMAQGEGRVMQRERMQRLAFQKYEELVATGEYATAGQGDFEDQGEPGYGWSVEVEPSGVENLDGVTVTVQPEGQREADDEVSITGLVFKAPIETEAP